jgi:hypothetical protein
MNRYESLYARAIEAEAQSASPRIRALHERGRHCRVGLGITDERLTENLVVSRNPGGDFTQAAQQTVAESIDDCDMARYVALPLPHARNLRKVLGAYAETRVAAVEAVVNTFGVTNLSFFHSKDTASMAESFGIEVFESIETVIEEMRPLPLRTIPLSGVSYDLFALTLYQKGSPVTDHFALPGRRAWLEGFATTIRSGQRVKCVFLTHLSAPRGLADADMEALGTDLAEVL